MRACFRMQRYSMLSCFSPVQLFETLQTVARQAPLSTGFSRQQYWSGLLCPHPGDLPTLGTESMSLMSPALAGRFFTTSATWETPDYGGGHIILWIYSKQLNCTLLMSELGFPGGSDGKESACNVGDLGLIPRLGQPPGGQHGNPLQHSYLEIPQGQSNLQSIIHGVAKSRTWLSN